MGKPHLTIRMTLLIIVGGLNVLITLLVGNGVYKSWKNHQQAQELKLGSEMINALYSANKNLSLTRASTLAILYAPQAEIPSLLPDLLSQRKQVDQALDMALSSIKKKKLIDNDEAVLHIEERYRQLVSRRNVIDLTLTQALEDRDPELNFYYFEDNTALITDITRFILIYSHSYQDLDETISRYMMFEHFVWELAEHTGQQYAIIGQMLAENKYPSEQQHEKLTSLRGRIEYGWDILRNFSLNEEVSAKLSPLMEEASTQYFFTFDQIDVLFYGNYPFSTEANYPINSTLWLGMSAQAVDSLLILQDEILKETEAAVNLLEAKAKQEIFVRIIIFVSALTLSIYCLLIITFRVTRPFNAMVTALYKATHENIFEIPKINYQQDEIGKLVRVLEVFKNNAQKMKQSNEELERFAFIAAHDLKSPLRAIDNISHWLEEDVHELLPDASKKHLLELRNRVRLMEKMLDDTLEYARLDTKIESQPNTRVSGQQMMEEIIELLNIPPGFSINLGDGIAKLNLQKLPLQQVLFNLVNNAIKHHDKKVGLIEVNAQDTDTETIFWVSDDGPGIEAQYHQKIFEMFQTLQTREKSKGRGMGLAMVRKIITATGGTIKVESTLGGGAIFRFTWPKHSH